MYIERIVIAYSLLNNTKKKHKSMRHYTFFIAVEGFYVFANVTFKVLRGEEMQTLK